MKRIKEFFVTGLLVIMLLFTALWTFLKTPFHYIAYKRSHYYRDFGLKYQLFICVNPNYRMYNLIKSHSLPIRFIYEDPKDPAGHGYFVYKHTVIIHDMSQIQYRDDIARWVFRQARNNPDEPMPIFDYAMASLDAANALPGHDRCTHMLLLINRAHVLKADLPRAEQDKRFLLHDGKDLADILDAYIRTHPFG